MAEVGEIYQFIMDNKIIFFPILAVFGLIMAFFGLKLNKITFFLAGWVFGFALVMLFCTNTFVTRETEEKTMWIYFFVSVMCGIITGYATLISIKIGTFAIGGWLGYIISLMVYSAFLYKIESGRHNLVLWGSNVIGILVFGFLALSLYNTIIIVSSSLCGSFASVFAVGMLAGHFPDIYALAKQIRIGQLDNIEWQAYLYLASILILFILSSYY